MCLDCSVHTNVYDLGLSGWRVSLNANLIELLLSHLHARTDSVNIYLHRVIIVTHTYLDGVVAITHTRLLPIVLVFNDQR